MSTYKVLLPPGSSIIKIDGSWVEPLEVRRVLMMMLGLPDT